ncbi:transporter, partial [Sphingomonas sp. HMWF008]
GLALAELLLPFMNAAAGTALELTYFGADGVAWVLLATVVIIGTLAGVYPAFLLSRYAPAQVLASSRAPGSGRSGSRVREALVIAQFAIAITFIVATAVIFAQTLYVRAADLGFERRGILIVTSLRNRELSDAQRSAFVERARSLAGVRAVTQSDAAPGDGSVSNAGSVGRPGTTQRRPTLSQVRVGQDFFATYSARMLAGRALNARFGMDDLAEATGAAPATAARNTVINRSAAALLGFKSPEAAVGKAIEMDVAGGRRPLTIAGVIEDMRFESLRGPVSPTLYLYQSTAITNPVASLRFTGGDADVTAAVAQLWRSMVPQIPFEAVTAERSLAALYASDDQRSRLFLAGAVVAVLISCLGLYGLATFTTAQRTKEIGIRKALGASRRDVLLLVGGQMLRPVLLANVIAWPIAFFAMRSWLEGFDRRIDLGIIFFLSAGLLAATIAAVTVLAQVLRISGAEPAWALRHE